MSTENQSIIFDLCEKLGILKQLRNRGYIDEGEDGEFVFTEKAIRLVEEGKEREVNIQIEDPSVWIDEFLDLFPKGVQTAGYYVRGDRRSCVANLRKFVKKYPEYNKDIILKATENYIERCRRKEWAYMQIAQNFVMKNTNSTLAAECQHIIESGNVETSNPFQERM